MSSRLLARIGKTQRLAILEEIKRSGRGLPVKELAARLKMSYMGIKDLCLDLQKNGLLKTWRNPRPVGRPELEYRLTKRANEAFPRHDVSALLSVLRGADRLYGGQTASKLLLLYFQEKAAGYQDKLASRGATPQEKGKWLARLRDAEGHYAVWSHEDGFALVENHQPLAELFTAYPEAGRMEEQMIGRVLGCPVSRHVSQLEGCYECRFLLQVLP
jgi:predicted ArsR family transcriptional regulator